MPLFEAKKFSDVRAEAYDVVLNGVEIGGGSMRIYEPELQDKMFEALGISPENRQAQFGHLLRALHLGAPPHGGIALGLDRLVMLLAGEHSSSPTNDPAPSSTMGRPTAALITCFVRAPKATRMPSSFIRRLTL